LFCLRISNFSNSHCNIVIIIVICTYRYVFHSFRPKARMILLFGRKPVAGESYTLLIVAKRFFTTNPSAAFSPLENKNTKNRSSTSTMQKNSIGGGVSSIVSSPSSLVIFPSGESDDCTTLSLDDRKSPTTLFLVDRPTHKFSWDFFRFST